jgi:hypothetical protein
VRFGGILEWRPRPTPGCSTIEEEEEEEEVFYCIPTTGWNISNYLSFKSHFFPHLVHAHLEQ